MQCVSAGLIQIVGCNEILSRFTFSPSKCALHQVRRILVELQRKDLGRGLKVVNRMRRIQFKIDSQMPGRL